MRSNRDIKDRNAARGEAIVGQLCGLLIGLMALGTAGWAAINGAEWFASALGVGGIAGLVGVFVYGRKNPPRPPS